MKGQPHVSHHNPFENVPKCGAHSRRTGKACRQPAMKNGRCRLHGGKSTGAPIGNRNAFKHGLYTAESIEQRKYIRDLVKESRNMIDKIAP